jgi:hypothetical protein
MPRFAQGKFTLKNPEKYVGNKNPTYRSSWEFAFCRFCDEHPSVSQWASEAIKIPYRNPLTGKYTVYVPDFFIAYANRDGKQKVELIEVKPASQAFKENLGRSKHNQAHYTQSSTLHCQSSQMGSSQSILQAERHNLPHHNRK